MPTRRNAQLRFGAACLIALAALALVLVVRDLRGQVSDLQQGNTPASVRARQDRAENRFILCSRTTMVVDPRKQAEIDRLCDGYSTLAESYRSQDVPAP